MFEIFRVISTFEDDTSTGFQKLRPKVLCVGDSKIEVTLNIEKAVQRETCRIQSLPFFQSRQQVYGRNGKPFNVAHAFTPPAVRPVTKRF